MTKTQSPMPFPIHLSVENGNEATSATTLLTRFIERAAQTFELTLIAPPSGTTSHAESTLSVPFAERENIRIFFNIFASEMDDEYGTGFYFHMESAF